MKKIFNISLMLSVSCWAQAGGVSVPHNFSPNTPAKASEVNANFAALVAKINQLENRIADLEGNSVIALDGVLKLGTYDADEQYPTAIFEGVNLQVVDGTGTTDGSHGAGNVIIGYNEFSGSSPDFCSNPSFDNQLDCEIGGFIWDNNVHRGSHNLVLGKGNSFDNYAGIVAGADNISNGTFASVLGGQVNTATGQSSVVVGGHNNLSSGFMSVVSGGEDNKASALTAVVSGGSENVSSGDRATVSGGRANLASGLNSMVTGGGGNHALGEFSIVTGGSVNLASGAGAVVSGGAENIASGDLSSVTAGEDNVASGDLASVNGGGDNEASGVGATVSGGVQNVSSALGATISGGQARTATDEFDWVGGSLTEDN